MHGDRLITDRKRPVANEVGAKSAEGKSSRCGVEKEEEDQLRMAWKVERKVGICGERDGNCFERTCESSSADRGSTVTLVQKEERRWECCPRVVPAGPSRSEYTKVIREQERGSGVSPNKDCVANS
jgi:hypothetical protein